MNKRTIKWEKFVNPLIPIDQNGEESESKVMLRHTPFGVEGMQINQEFPSEKVFVGHTDFDIDEDVKNIIDNTEGVEVFDIYSAYRFRITVGKNFNSKTVRRMIEENIQFIEKPLDLSVENDLSIYKETLELKSTGKPWVMLVLPNGKFDSVIIENKNDLEDQITLYNTISNRLGGLVLHS